MMTTTSPPITVNPELRIQVLFENELGMPTKEFKAGILAEPTFDALVTHVFRMTSFGDSLDDYNITFKYRIEEKHASRWVNFDNSEGLGYAIQSNQARGYAFISVSVVKKGAIAPTMVSPSPARSTKGTAKPKVAKKTRTTKAKAPTPRKSTGPKLPVEQKILTALKELLDLGIAAPPRLQIALFSGYSNLQSLGFKTAMKKLVTDGLVEYPDKETMSLTQTGVAQAPTAATPATTNEQVQARLKSMLKDKAPVIFDILHDGRPHIREELAAQVGYSNVMSKGFKDALKQMISLKMVEHPDGNKNLVQLTDIAFPFGRPDATMSVVSNDDVKSE